MKLTAPECYGIVKCKVIVKKSGILLNFKKPRPDSYRVAQIPLREAVLHEWFEVLQRVQGKILTL